MKSDIIIAIIYTLSLLAIAAIVILWFLSAATVQADAYWQGDGNSEAVITAEPGHYEQLVNDGSGVIGYPGTLRVVDGEFAKGFLPIAWCESGYKTDAIGALGELGIMQIHPIHVALILKLGYYWEQMTEAAPNIVVAVAIWERTKSFEAWSCSNH